MATVATVPRDRRVLITGAAGLLGRHLVAGAPSGTVISRTWRNNPLPVAADGSDHRLDLADRTAVQGIVDTVGPDLVVHAAYDLDDHAGGIVAASRNVAEACAAAGAELIHVSSDVVFDGEHAPYDEHHPLCPVTDYGRAKAQAESDVSRIVQDAAIVRTTLLCAMDPPDPRTAWIIDALRGGGPVTLFADEFRMPARVDDVADRIWRLSELGRADRAGPWHVVGPDEMSRVAIGHVVAAGLDLQATALVEGRSADLGVARPRDLRLSITRPDTPMTPNRSIATLFDPVVSGG